MIKDSMDLIVYLALCDIVEGAKDFVETPVTLGIALENSAFWQRCRCCCAQNVNSKKLEL